MQATTVPTAEGAVPNPEELLEMFRMMYLIRVFEDRTGEMYTRAKIGGFLHLNIGEEAAIVGVFSALRPEDYVVTSYRSHGHALAKGVDPKGIMAELFGRETGVAKGRGGSMHLFDASTNFLGGYAIVGGQLPVAAGIGTAIDYRGSDEVVMALMGDGATNIGAFHESLNLARVWRLPIVFVVVNNGYGMGTAVDRASAVPEIWRKAAGYDMPGERVDGMDLLATRKVAIEAVRRAREEHMPSLIEVFTYRYRGHSMADPGKYRSEDEVKRWQERDPINSFAAWLEREKVASPEDLARIRAEVEQVVNESVQFADESPEPSVDDLYKYVMVDEGEAPQNA
jgi:pyruvate dehydrogenase E1 component alpha subunit